MRLTLFTASFLSVVAAGWTLLDAGAPSDGPARKPALREVTIDGAPVRITLDRDRVPVGESVQVGIALTEAHAGGLDVRVAVLEQSGSPMARVMPPPREISSQVVHLGDSPTQLPIKLAGDAVDPTVDPLLLAGNATQYTIEVSSIKKDAGAVAALPVFAYQPEAFRLTVDAPAAGKDGDTVDVVVHVESLSDKPLRGLGFSATSTFATINDNPTIETLAPGEQQTLTLHGTRIAPIAGLPALVQAYGWASYGGSATAYVTLDASGAIAERASEPFTSWGS